MPSAPTTLDRLATGPADTAYSERNRSLHKMFGDSVHVISTIGGGRGGVDLSGLVRTPREIERAKCEGADCEEEA